MPSVPSVVLKKIVKIQRDFLWDWKFDWRKIAWASREKVCESRDVGGLGIIDIKVFNTTLLGKWISHLGSTKGELWKEVLG